MQDTIPFLNIFYFILWKNYFFFFFPLGSWWLRIFHFMIHSSLGLCTTDSSSWILLFPLSRRLMHSCLWEQQHLFLLIPAFNPSNLLQCLDSHLTFLSLVFRVLAPHSPSIPISGVFPSCAKTRHIISLSLPLCLILISVLCSVAWKARCPCSLCAKAVYRHLQDFPCHQTPWMACSWYSADFTNVLRC